MNWLAERFELTRGGAASNSRSMEGLRGFAVFLVFLVHYVTLVTPWIRSGTPVMYFAEALHALSNTGVDLFFVLSGYLIYGSLFVHRQSYLQFMRRRVRRIYPAFIVVFAIYVLLSFAFPRESKWPADPFGAIVYLTQNFFLLPGLFPIDPMISVAWSLSYEMLYYLAMPIVGPYRLVMFIAGILVFEAMKAEGVPVISGHAGVLALAVGWAGMVFHFDGSLGTLVQASLLFTAFFILCLACFKNPGGWLSRLFGWTPLRWLGNISYSYYLLHGLALKASFLVLSSLAPGRVFDPWLFWVLLPVLFLVSLLPTIPLFLTVERPFSLLPAGREPRQPAPGLA